MYNPYFIQQPPQYPTYNNGYYGQMDQNAFSVAGQGGFNQNAFSAQGQSSPTGVLPQPGASSYINAATGALSLGANLVNMGNQDLSINAQLPNNYSSYGGGELTSQINNARPQGASFGEIASSAGQGATTGMAFGPWGAAAGAVVGGVGAAIMGGRRKRRQQRQKAADQQRLGAYQQNFNQAQQSMQQQANAYEDYMDSNNLNNRLYNVFRSQNG